VTITAPPPVITALGTAGWLSKSVGRYSDVGGGQTWASSQAASVLRMAGIAAALGHRYVPVLAQELDMLGYVMDTLKRWAPQGRITREFETLLARMHVLHGMAGVCRWEVVFDDAVGGMRWRTEPDVPSDAARRALPEQSGASQSAGPGARIR